MSGNAWVVGVASTPFARMGDRTHASLAEEVVTASLKDAGTSGADVGRVWFGNCGMHGWGQPNIRGQVALKGMLRDGRLSSDAGVVNIEAACSTGSAVFADAVAAARAGAVDVALAVGVEKVFHPGDLQATFGVFIGGADIEGRKEWLGYLAEQARLHDLPWAPHPARIVFVDVHALAAQHHMKTYGTTAEQLAYVAAKDHAHGALNPLAQYDTPTDPAEVLADKGVVGPFTRSMCCPVSDGAVSVVVVSDAGLQRLPPEVRERAVRVLAAELTGGRWRGLDEPSVVDRGVERAFAVAGIEGGDVDVAEVHDASSFCEIAAVEALGLCPRGEGGPFSASGATRLGGQVPVNTSGGLVSKGHPLAATGLGMIQEITLQLRGEAGERQVEDATLGVTQNAGGLVAVDEAMCGVAVLARA